MGHAMRIRSLLAKNAVLAEGLLVIGTMLFQRLHVLMYDSNRPLFEQVMTWQGLFLLLSISCAGLIVWIAKYITKPLHSGIKAAAECLLMLACNELKAYAPQNASIRGRIWIKSGDYFVSIAQWPRRERDEDNEIILKTSDVKRLIIGEAFFTPRVIVRDINENDKNNYTDAIREFIPPSLQTVLARSIGSQQHSLRLGVVSFDSNVSLCREWDSDEPREIIAKVASVLHAMLSGK